MKIVPENINEVLGFERGKEPIKSMGIGKEVIDREIIKNTEWKLNPIDPDWEIIELIRDYKGFPIVVIKDITAMKENQLLLYFAISPVLYSYWTKTPEKTIKIIKEKIDKFISNNNRYDIDESLNFERGKEPIKAMNVGQTFLDKKFVEETNWDFGTLDDDDEVVELIRDYRGYPILIITNKKWSKKNSGFARYIVSTIAGINFASGDTLDPLIEKVKDLIDLRKSKLSSYSIL
jgi:hypothetical protein